MIRDVTFATKCRTIPAGLTIKFLPGVNLLVGDQGCGKSTVLSALCQPPRVPDIQVSVIKDDGTKLKFFDFERSNPRTSSGFGNGLDMGTEVDALFMSHGQAVVRMLADLCKRSEPHTFLLDEPDTGMSIRSAVTIAKFFQLLALQGHQIIAPVHNPVLIMRFPEVYSLEHHKWMTANDFVDTQFKPAV